jgi:hypothetical protein
MVSLMATPHRRLASDLYPVAIVPLHDLNLSLFKTCFQNYLCRFETAMQTQAGPEWEELDGSSSARDDLQRCMAQGQSSYHSMPRTDARAGQW